MTSIFSDTVSNVEFNAREEYSIKSIYYLTNYVPAISTK